MMHLYLDRFSDPLDPAVYKGDATGFLASKTFPGYSPDSSHCATLVHANEYIQHFWDILWITFIEQLLQTQAKAYNTKLTQKVPLD